MSYVIFSIDKSDDPMVRSAFFGMYSNRCKALVGCYKGVHEVGYIMDKSVFDEHIRDSHWIVEQESILHVASGNKMECYLEFMSDGSREALGCMHEVSEAEALSSEAWSYRPDMNVYWVAKKGNPDKVGV